MRLHLIGLPCNGMLARRAADPGPAMKAVAAVPQFDHPANATAGTAMTKGTNPPDT